MSCKGKLCCKAVFSASVTFADGTVIINVPQRSFNNGEKICLFVTQNIPATATIGSPVVLTIGTSAVQYPLTRCNCASVTACGIRSRSRYPLQLVTTANGGSFRVLKNLCCAPQETLASVPTPTVPAQGGNA